MKHPAFHPLLFLAALILLAGSSRPARAGGETPENDPQAEARAAFFARMEADILAGKDDPVPAPPQGVTPCVGGFAGSYACNKVDLLAHMPLNTIGGGTGAEVWGWTDPQDGTEYAIFARSSGTSFIDLSNPASPVYLGTLPPHTSNSTWRSIKVYDHYVVIGSEASGHGMQVFDLHRLRTVVTPPVVFTEDAHYNGFGSSHTIEVNAASGYAIAAGSNSCSGGLHIVNIQNPLSPVFGGCFSADGYTHEAQCVLYTGPDTQHAGKDICFAYNEDTVTIVNITTPASPVQLSETPYTGSAYTHQGWLTADQKYILVDDELDETSFGHNTRTRVFDVSDLDDPFLVGFYDGPTGAIDHNLYIHNGFAFESNYTAGLRILDLTNVASASLTEAGFFDMYTPNNNASFSGTWGNYPFFDSGIVLVSGINEGLFILQPQLIPDFSVTLDAGTLAVCPGGKGEVGVSVSPKSGYAGTVNLNLASLILGITGEFDPASVAVPGTSTLTLTVQSSVLPGSYEVGVQAEDGNLLRASPLTVEVAHCNYLPAILNNP
jgi:choice-of-anchor B domain-containing protein